MKNSMFILYFIEAYLKHEISFQQLPPLAKDVVILAEAELHAKGNKIFRKSTMQILIMRTGFFTEQTYQPKLSWNF